MTFNKTRIFGALFAIGFLVASLSAYGAPLNSNTASVSLSATLAESLTVAATPSSVSFTLVSGGTANGSAPVAVTTAWVLNRNRTSVSLVGYFSSATAALTDGGSPAITIPTSEVLGRVTTGTPTTYTAFTGSPALAPAGAGLGLFTQTITDTNRAANRSDNLDLQINLTAQPQLPAGTYTGTLSIQAQAL